MTPGVSFPVVDELTAERDPLKCARIMETVDVGRGVVHDEKVGAFSRSQRAEFVRAVG
ncbi:MAG: hypothetical protein ABEI99_08320 [Halobaculum sp.]